MVAMALSLPPPPPAPSSSGDNGSAKRSSLLDEVQAIVRGAITGGEPRMWLCTALGSLPVPRSAQREAFLGLLSSQGHGSDAVVERLVRMLCDRKPSWAARVLARDDRLLRRFFSGNSKRIEQWFGKFSSSSEGNHEFGARALARYTFLHRESCWQELVWSGKHGQAPATVASKPHYFLELDVLKTMDNFLDNVPSFWRSEELWESMKEGEFLSLDMDFFTKELVLKLLVDDCPETWRTVEDYLADESFSTLANGVLHFLSDDELLRFLNDLVKQLSEKQMDYRKSASRERGKDWLEEIVLSGEKCNSLNDAIICNACTNYKRQILNIIRDEEHEAEAEALQQLFAEADNWDAGSVWSLRWEGLTANRWVSVKWLALEGWLLYAYLSLNCQKIDFAQLFKENGIEFQAPLPLIAKKRKKKQRKRNRKKHKHLEDLETSSEVDDAVTATIDECWRLSTDGFSFSWRREDLPEHLSGYAFGRWLKWAVSFW